MVWFTVVVLSSSPEVIANIERTLSLMIMRILIALVIAGIVGASATGCSSVTHSGALAPTTTSLPTSSSPQVPRVGKVAPDFALDTLDGSRKVHLSDFRGKAVLLIFWTSTCTACVKELPAIQRFSVQQRAGSKQMAVLAVDMDRVGDFVNVTTLQERFGLTYPILVDDHFQARSSYQITNIPVAFFIDRQHMIRTILSGALNDTSLRNAAANVEGE